MDFNATSLYPSAMWDDESVHPEIETGYPVTPKMNDELLEMFSSGYFIQGSAVFEVKCCNPPELIYQHLPVKKRVNKVEVNRMRKSYSFDTLTSADIKKILLNRGKIIEIYEGVIYRKHSRVNPFSKVIGKIFGKRKHYKDPVMMLWNYLLNSYWILYLEIKYENIWKKNMLVNQNTGCWLNMMKRLKNIGV